MSEHRKQVISYVARRLYVAISPATRAVTGWSVTIVDNPKVVIGLECGEVTCSEGVRAEV